jgi:glutamyl-tRNA reductase
MPITCVGVSHHTAPLEVREQLAFDPGAARALLGQVRDPELVAAGIGELTLISTCNRTELYAASTDPASSLTDVPALLIELLLSERGLDAGELDPPFYTLTGLDALRHLCQVAAGLDSMILGEAEVMGQLAEAERLAIEVGAAGPILGAAFRTALRAGRRARAETGICRHPMSVASEAVGLVRERAPDNASVLIIGTGKVARLLADVLRNKGFTHLAIAGRSPQRARAIASPGGATVVPWSELDHAIRVADVVLASTSAGEAVVTRAMIEAARVGREPARPLLLLDLAVPRNIEPDAATLAGVALHDLDSLQRRLDGNLAERSREVPRVRAIVDQEVQLFEAWRKGAVLKPLLAAMYARGEAIRQRETARAMRQLRLERPDLHDQVEALTRSLVAKLLHAPVARLRSETDPERSELYAGALRDLFDLDLPESEPVIGVILPPEPQAHAEDSWPSRLQRP